MPEMRTCKECGKLFIPKGREQYCSDIHYRPCPICGKPVEAKYLSDPPRKCSNCRGKKAPRENQSFKEIPRSQKSLFSFKPQDSTPKREEVPPKRSVVAKPPKWIKEVDLSEQQQMDQAVFCEIQTGAVRMYIGNEHKNSFIPGHKYLLHVERDEYTYKVTSTEDVTLSETVDIVKNYSSQTSFNSNFSRLKEDS